VRRLPLCRFAMFSKSPLHRFQHLDRPCESPRRKPLPPRAAVAPSTARSSISCSLRRREVGPRRPPPIPYKAPREAAAPRRAARFPFHRPGTSRTALTPRFRREFNGLRHALEPGEWQGQHRPTRFLHAHQQQHEVGADGKICRVIGNDKPRRSCRPGPPALRVCKIKLIMSAPSEFILLWNSMHPHAVAKINPARLRNFSSPLRWISSPR